MAMSKRANLILSVVAQSYPNLKSGAMRDFENILKDMGIMDQWKINRTDKTYQFGSNVVEFFAVEGEDSRLGSRRTHLYINELDSIRLETFIELEGRTADFTIADYNPRRKFWAHDEYIGQDWVDFLILTYKDNEYIPANELRSILWYKEKAETENKPYWINKWRVLGLGELGIVEGQVFENWEKIEAVPEEAKYLGAGLDFGFSNDPTALTKIWAYDNKIILEESLYRKGMLNSSIAKHINQDKDISKGLTVCDSSEPKTIAELRGYGIPIKGAKKVHGSILSGIAIMQEYNLLIVGENLRKEFENYSYQKDNTGKSLGIPIDDHNHGIDGIRYFFLERMGSRFNAERMPFKWVA